MPSDQLSELVQSQEQSIQQLTLSCARIQRVHEALQEEHWEIKQRLDYFEKQLAAMQRTVGVVSLQTGIDYGQQY